MSLTFNLRDAIQILRGNFLILLLLGLMRLSIIVALFVYLIFQFPWFIS